MKFAIIGAGWYGCHIASALKAIGFDVTVYDKSSRILNQASGNNQFRLHLGFHYPRHHGTRTQSRDGYFRFIERYGHLTNAVPENIYGVAKHLSDIDFQTYKIIMSSSGVEFSEVRQIPPQFRNIEGAISTSERVLMITRAREYFSSVIVNNIRLNCPVQSVIQSDNGVYIDGDHFDYAVDATWGHLLKPDLDVYYEPTLLLYYDGPRDSPALTLVDGALCSLYPTEDPNVFTLSSVPHTPLAHCKTANEAIAVKNSVTEFIVEQKRELMEQQIIHFFPGFRDRFRFLGPQLSIKTKVRGQADDRSCYVSLEGRVFTVMSGKIDTIFHATNRMLSLLEIDHYGGLSIEARLRDDIVGMFGGPQ